MTTHRRMMYNLAFCSFKILPIPRLLFPCLIALFILLGGSGCLLGKERAVPSLIYSFVVVWESGSA
jgi:hypothetical protein